MSGTENRWRTTLGSITAGRGGAQLVYLALTGLLGLSAWAAIRHGDRPLVDLFAGNLAAEALGLIVTLVLVQRYLERQERALRLRGSLGAVRRSGRALARMVDAWTELVKGGLERAPEPRPAELAEVVAPDLTAALLHLDPRLPEVIAAARNLADARDALRAVIAMYGARLDPIYLGAIDDLTDDPFLAALSDAATLQRTTPDDFRSVLRAARATRVIHFERLLLAIQCHNQLARDAARLRDPRTAPRGDGYTTPLPLDVDLRVHTPVAPEWWSVAPRPGSLRAVRFRDDAFPDANARARSDLPPDLSNALGPNDLGLSDGAVRPFPMVAASPDASLPTHEA